MAQVNAAYDLLRAGGGAPPPSARPKGRGAEGHGAWLPAAVRRALGRELLEALEPGEDVRHVTPTATWASARALLVVTDRRLLWLLDDVVGTHRAVAPTSRIASIQSHLRLAAATGGDPARGGRRRAAVRIRRAAAARSRGDRQARAGRRQSAAGP